MRGEILFDDALCEVTVCVCALVAPWVLGLGAAMNVAIVAVAAFPPSVPPLAYSLAVRKMPR